MASKEEKLPKTGAADKASSKRHSNPLVYYGTIFILVIVVIAFVWVPAMGSGVAGRADDLTFGTWRNKPIRFAPDSFFSSQIEEVKEYYNQQGMTEDNAQFLHYQIWRQAFENTVIHTALLDQAKQHKLTVSDEYLDVQMTKHPYFIDNGVFSLRRFREAPVHVKASIRDSIRESVVKSRFVSDQIPVYNSNETEFIKEMAREERSLDFVSFSLDNYPDSERLQFAAANPAPFRQINLSRITLTGTEKEANDLRSRIDSGAILFEDAARNSSRDGFAARGGALDWRYNWELRSDFDNPDDLTTLMQLPAGSLSPVYKSSTGSWLLFRVEEDSRSPDSLAADYLATVKDYMNRFEKGRIEDWGIKQAEQFKAAWETDGYSGEFGDFAASRGLLASRTNSFPLNYGNLFDLGYFSLFDSIDSTQTPQLAAAHTNIRFLETVFGLRENQLSEPLVLGNNVIVLKVAEILEAEEFKLSMISSYYPYLLQESVQNELSRSILADPRFKDSFIDTYIKNFSL